jgi:hypothetical protein
MFPAKRISDSLSAIVLPSENSAAHTIKRTNLLISQAVNFVTKVGAICHTMAVELGTKLGQMPLAVCLARDFQQKRE